MALIYDSLFVGIIKFFDKKKGFGYIATNNHGMNFTDYDQGIYIDSESFIDGKIQSNESIVVFQIEQRKVNQQIKTHGVNVRPYSNNVDDIELLLSYYQTHELIHTDRGTVNLFSKGISRSDLLNHVLSLILNSANRSSETSLQHFKHCVDIFEHRQLITDGFVHYEYIFDRDFNREEKAYWSTLFSNLNPEEKEAILFNYPSTLKYFNDTILAHHFAGIFFNDASIGKVLFFKELMRICSNEIQISLTPIINDVSDKLFNELVQQVNNGVLQTEGEFTEKSRAFLTLNQKKYGCKIDELHDFYKVKQFRIELKKLEDNKSARTLTSVINCYNLISDSNKRDNEQLFKDALHRLRSIFVDKKMWRELEELLSITSGLFPDFIEDSRNTISPLIVNSLLLSIEESINSPSELKDLISDKYNKLSKYFSLESDTAFKDSVCALLPKTDSVASLYYLARQEWILESICLARYKEIVGQWDLEALNQHLSDYESVPVQDSFREIVIDRATKLLQGKPLKEPLVNKKYWAEDFESYNVHLLRRIESLLPKNKSVNSWEQYIVSLDNESIIELNRRNLLHEIPRKTIKWIIESLTLESIQGSPSEWYSRPVLKSKHINDILSSTSEDLFDIIAPILSSFPITIESIPLAFFLAELMSYNKPKESADYKTRNQWNKRFLNQIKSLADSSDNQLKTVLWATYFESSGSIKELKASFFSFPPYIQIRVVRKLFQLIALGRIKYNAKTLYQVLGGGQNSMALPLEITFKCLIAGEDGRQFRYNEMLSVLHNRPDHQDWEKVSLLMSSCKGRIKFGIDENSQLGYGIAYESPGEIRIHILPKMVDWYGHMSKYNNTKLNIIREYISISFDSTDYVCFDYDSKIEYSFSIDSIRDVIIMCSVFNIHLKDCPPPPGVRRANTVFAGNTTRVKEENPKQLFCECRESNNDPLLYWCDNKPCNRTPLRFMTSFEWEYYTILDFMRIFDIPVDYQDGEGKRTRFGQYIFLSSFFHDFTKFYEHLKCRDCGALMTPKNLSNYAAYAVTEFICTNQDCSHTNETVYLNHCFNKPKCRTIIDSRDSKQCPNGYYVCPKCGGCCSTKNSYRRLVNLQETGGSVSLSLKSFVDNNLGHWEKGVVYCYKCGMELHGLECKTCGVVYHRP